MEIVRGEADIAYVNIGGHAFSSVRLDNLRFGPESTTTTDALGGYSLPGLPAGQYNVAVTPVGGFRGLDASSSRPVTLASNEMLVGIDFGFTTDSSPWQNPTRPLDVNNDNFISPIDVLLIVNDINANEARDLRGSGLSTPPFIDVNGDSFVSAIDVLLVVNFLNG